MKKLLIILLIFPIVCFSKNNVTVSDSISKCRCFFKLKHKKPKLEKRKTFKIKFKKNDWIIE